MKILITGTTGESMPPPYGGVPKLSLLVAGVWKKMGHEVAINFVYRPEKSDDLGAGATYFFDYNSKPDKVKKIVFLVKNFLHNPFLYAKLFASYYKISGGHALGETVLYSAYGVHMDRIIAKWKPDIILAEAVLIKTYMVAVVARRRNIPVVFDSYAEVHDLSMGINKHLNEQQRVAYWKPFLELADLVVSAGPLCCRGPLTYLPKEKVTFVYDGSDYSLCNLDIKDDVSALRDLLKLPQDQFLIGNVGSFELRKGHDYLIRAIGILVKAGHKIGAVICGGSGDSTKWRELAKQEGVAENIHFFARLSELDLARVYKSLDAFSDLENTPRACGFTMSVLEGMAMGLPVVVFENPELFEAVKEGVNGFSVPINDTEALAAAILKMQQLSPERRKEMGQDASARAKRIDITFTAEGKLDLFKKILASRGSK